VWLPKVVGFDYNGLAWLVSVVRFYLSKLYASLGVWGWISYLLLVRFALQIARIFDPDHFDPSPMVDNTNE